MLANVRVAIALAVACVMGSFLAIPLEADRGVGVNVGRIEINDVLSAGRSYDLPAVGVINTGDEVQDYEVEITHLEVQSQRKPDPQWFNFSPQHFSVQPGKTQMVDISVTIPGGAKAGNYFAYVEAHSAPTGKGETIGIAAATKLLFSVKQSSWLTVQRYRINDFIDSTQPWIVLVPVVAGLLLLVFKNRQRIPFEIRRKI
jgi:hypothetical protein